MKTFKNIIIIAVLVGVLLTVKFIFFPAEDTDTGKSSKSSPVMVEVYMVKPAPLDNRIFISGTIMPNEEVSIVPEVAGKVVGIYFNEGSQVAKGQLLVKLNDANLRAQLKKLQVREKMLTAQEQRLAKLLEIKSVSQEEYETLVSELDAIKADIGVNRTQLDETEIRAPFSGKIGIKNISEGSFVSTTNVIAILQQADPVKLDFYVPEKYAHLVSTGDTLSFSLEGKQKRVQAKISAIDPLIDQTTRTLRVRAVAPNKDHSIIPGAFARINFLLDHTETALLIPTEAIVPVQKGKKVFVVRNGKAEEVMVETGLRTENSIQIISGLQAGDSVVVRGLMQIKPGSSIKLPKNKK